MASNYSIEQPYPLFSLPQSIDTSAGRVTGGASFSINGSRKRKRTEVVVGVDGESLNVYDVKTPSLIASHALPPQAYLTAPPTSVHCKASSTGPASRLTYAAVRNELVTADSQILLFQEELRASPLGGEGTARKTVKTFGTPGNPVIYLEPLCSESEEQCPNVLVVQEGGQIACFSGDLEESPIWTAGIPQPTTSGGQYVEHVSVQDASTSKEGFLRERMDILATLDHAGVQHPESDNRALVIVLVTRSGKSAPANHDSRMLHVMGVRPRVPGSKRGSVVQLLHSWTLPTHKDTLASTAKCQWSFGKKGGSLLQLSGGCLYVYDFGGLTPQLLSKIDQPEEEITSFLPMSSATSLTASKNHCGVWDLRYRSLQALQSVVVHEEPTNRFKRKHSLGGAADQPLMFLEYFSSLSTAVALAGSQLVAVQVQSSSRLKRRKTDKARIIDCLGKSMAAYDASSSERAGKSSDYARWSSNTKAMSSAAARCNQKEFDALFAAAMNVKTDKADIHLEAAKVANRFQPFELQEAFLFTLGKIFAWSVTSSKAARTRPSSIRMVFRPKRALGWLAAEGCLSPAFIENALRRHRSLDHSQATVTSKDVVTALANYDSTLELLCRYVESLQLDLVGAAEAVKILLQSFDTPPRLADDRLLTNGAHGTTELEVQAEEEAAAQDLTIVASLLNGEPDARNNALQHTLEQLARRFPPSELVQSLRSQLSRRDIALLIELLRVALSEGGWTSRYLDFFPTDTDDQPSGQDEALSSICTLLNCALDALGTGGWLGGAINDVDEDTSSLLSQLRGDTSAVLEGVQESTFFAGFLKDFVRYERLAKDTPAASKKPRDKKVVPANLQDVGSILPLGVKAADKILTTKVGLGGEVRKRSQRDIGRDLSEKVAKYSFETIRV